MEEIVNIYKPQGMTPLQVIRLLRTRCPELADAKIGYAGRLDPLAHGVLLLMVGDANKEREKYIGLEKEYEFRVVFGFQTDTFDYLGLMAKKFQILNFKSQINSNVRNTNDQNVLELENYDFDIVSNFGIRISDLNNFATSKLGKQIVSYPPFSSKTIDGVPLFQLSKDGKLEGKELPARKVTINEFICLSIDTITAQDLKKLILSNIAKVTGDFRQQEITEQWEAFFLKNSNKIFTTAKFALSCSSGTYVRSLVNEMGESLGCGAIALEIVRTRVGEYTLEDSLRL